MELNKHPQLNETPKGESARQNLLISNENDAKVKVQVLVIIPGGKPIIVTGTSVPEAKELAYAEFWERCGTDERFEGEILVSFL